SPSSWAFFGCTWSSEVSRKVAARNAMWRGRRDLFDPRASGGRLEVRDGTNEGAGGRDLGLCLPLVLRGEASAGRGDRKGRGSDGGAGRLAPLPARPSHSSRGAGVGGVRPGTFRFPGAAARNPSAADRRGRGGGHPLRLREGGKGGQHPRRAPAPRHRPRGGEAARDGGAHLRRQFRGGPGHRGADRKSTRLNSSHVKISYA